MALSSKQFMDLPNLTLYDTLIKAYASALSDLAIKTILFSADGDEIYFFKKANATASDIPDYTFSLTNLTSRVTALENKGVYAGGTKVTLNGVDKTNSEASFYASTEVGSRGQILTSSGSGEPTWQNPIDATLPVFTNQTLVFEYESALIPTFNNKALVFK